ncbi:hypothetical protein DL770_003853 [Monosporascus sp. CRB-9-2]|nr:hypothetical protein DL770_003853 [Monosporascus sp. CRB-9-2]
MDPAPWTDDGDGAFELQSTTSWSPPNAGRVTFSFKKAVNGTTQQTHAIRHPLVSGLVPGTGYKTVLVYNA